MEELKEVVTRTLEKKGVLAKLRAELRSCVFEAIDEQGKADGQGLDALVPDHFRQFQATPEGQTVCALVYEFLEWSGLEYSLKVYAPESQSDSFQYTGRHGLMKELGLSGESSGERPLLAAVLKGKGGGGGAAGGSAERGGARSRLGAVDRLKGDAAHSPPAPEGSDSPNIRDLKEKTGTFDAASNFVKDSTDGLYSTVQRQAEATPEKDKAKAQDLSLSGDALSLSGDKLSLSAEKLKPLPALGGGRKSLDPLPPLRGGASTLGPLDSPGGKSNMSAESLNKSQDLSRSLDLGRSGDLSENYSAEFDREIAEEIDDDDLNNMEVVDEEAHSEESFELAEHDGNPGMSSLGGKGVSMDMMMSGLSASDRSGELDLEDDADLIESAEMG